MHELRRRITLELVPRVRVGLGPLPVLICMAAVFQVVMHPF